MYTIDLFFIFIVKEILLQSGRQKLLVESITAVLISGFRFPITLPLPSRMTLDESFRLPVTGSHSLKEGVRIMLTMYSISVRTQ